MNDKTFEYDYFNSADSTILVSHRFPWKVSEIAGLLILFASGIALSLTVQPPFFGILFAAATPYLAYVNNSRKSKSELLLAMTPVGLKVYKGRKAVANPNFVFQDKIVGLSKTKDMNGNKFVVLKARVERDGKTEETGFKIPERLYTSDGGRGYIDGVVASNDVTVPDEVIAFMRDS